MELPLPLNQEIGAGQYRADLPGDEFHGHEHEEEIAEGLYTLDALDDPNIRITLESQSYEPVGDVYEDQHYQYMRGDSKDTYGVNLRVWTRNSAGPEYYSPAVSFRCARD